jgi:hypothetical protein
VPQTGPDDSKKPLRSPDEVGRRKNSHNAPLLMINPDCIRGSVILTTMNQSDSSVQGKGCWIEAKADLPKQGRKD